MAEGSLAKKQPRVIVIEADKELRPKKLRVAAYARVSSDSTDQLNSFMAQVRYYTTYITSREEWTFVDLYADEGITGTSAEKRTEFQRLIADCKRGLIDKVLCKSISRFARNTTDCLETIRLLKGLGVGVCFEEQNIDTAQMSGELLTAIFAAISQKESESISGNMRWSYRRRMESGKSTCKAPFVRLPTGAGKVGDRQDGGGNRPSNLPAAIWKVKVRTRLRLGPIRWAFKRGTIVEIGMQPPSCIFCQTSGMRGTPSYKRSGQQKPCLMLKSEESRGRAKYYLEDSHPSIVPKEIFAAAQDLLAYRSQKIQPVRGQTRAPCFGWKPYLRTLRLSSGGWKGRRKPIGPAHAFSQ